MSFAEFPGPKPDGVTDHSRLRSLAVGNPHPQYALEAHEHDHSHDTTHDHDADYSATGHGHDYVSSSAAGVVIHGGSTTGVTSLGGDLTINYPDMSTVTALVPANGDAGVGGFYVAVVSKGTTSGVVRCFDSAGAPLVSTNVRIDWVVMGT